MVGIRGVGPGIAAYTSALPKPGTSKTPPLGRRDGVPVEAPTGPFQPNPPAPNYWRTSDAVNLRSGPGADYDRVTTLPAGTVLQVGAEVPADASWVPVTTPDGQTGWVSGDYADPVSAQEAVGIRHDFAALQRSSAVYINQLDAERDVDMTVGNSNCGPTSLAMALRQQGLTLPAIDGIEDNHTAGDEVQKARYAMYQEFDPSRDGVATADDGTSSYSETENSSYTGWSGLQAGADAAHADWQMLETADDIHRAVNSGKSVIVSGSFQDYDAAGDPTGADRELWLSGDARHGAVEHIVVVTGLTSDGSYIVNDPINGEKSPVVVSAADLQTFMNGNWGAMSVGPPTLSPAEARRLLR
jgi:hypothetical protein